jgi:hypothetical protein
VHICEFHQKQELRISAKPDTHSGEAGQFSLGAIGA